VKFLLLQARVPDDPVTFHERLCFRESLGIDLGDLIPHDLLAGPPDAEVMESVDCVLVGGSGDFSVAETIEERWLADFVDFMARLVDRKVPTFASCFGFQALVLAGGGKVESDGSRAEVGTFELQVTPEGANDRLFWSLAPSFHAQVGHKDHATVLPSGVVHLATSERSTYQAITIPGKPIYATQFHPELSRDRNEERFRHYRDAYTGAGLVDPPDTVLASFRETEPSSALMPLFVEKVLSPTLD
jgi:GMP synthase (glutamine-hydrolysing)